MYTHLLALHSLFRWLVLTSLVVSIAKAVYGWWANRHFSARDNWLRHTTATIAHIQLTLGLWLYFISPVVRYFLDNFKEGIHNRQIRFFGMEHSTMMLTGIIIITIGSAKAKRKLTSREKFRTIAIWYTIGLLVILSSVPWAFSPLVSRPWLRSF